MRENEKSLSLLWILGFVLFFSMPTSFGAVIGIVNASKVKVYSSAKKGGEVLHTLSKGNKVQVLAKNPSGTWYKIKVFLKGGFSFSGWVPTSSIQLAKKTSSSPKPVQPSFSPPPMTYSEPPTTAYSPPPPVPRRSKPSSWESSSYTGEKEPKFSLTPSISFLLFHYGLETENNTNPSVFSYNLTGLGVGLDFQYWFWQNAQGNFQTGTKLGFQHGFLSHNTSLASRTTPETQEVFDTRKTSSSTNHFYLVAKGEYKFGTGLRSPAVGFSFGLDYFNFSSDDILDLAGEPLGLYINHTTYNFPIGLYGKFSLKDFLISLGTDLSFFPMTSESPENSSGTDPKAGMAFSPFLELSYSLARNHVLKTGYELKFQNYSFQGDTAIRLEEKLVNAKAKTTLHQLSAKYEFCF